MRRLTFSVAAFGAFGLLAIFPAVGDDKVPTAGADHAKRRIESSIKGVVPKIALDGGKAIVERPTKSLVVSSSPTVAASSVSDNPKVEPGLVRWHADFASACAAAKQSRKPVLLFQMMGKLDEQFT